MAAVKAYKPETNSLSSGQVLQEPYSFKKARVVVMEMADAIALDLVDKRLVTDQLVLTISYDTESLNDPGVRSRYRGEITTDYYGRQAPKHAHGTANLERMTSSSRLIVDAVMEIYDRLAACDGGKETHQTQVEFVWHDDSNQYPAQLIYRTL